MSKDTSPFHGTNFKSIEESYSYVASVWGLRAKDGTITVNFDQSTSYSTLKMIANVTKTELITVKGTWTFVPLIAWECPGNCGRLITDETTEETVLDLDEKIWHLECYNDVDTL